jgi:hypothetical protein
MKLPQHGALFLLVSLHALEDVRENADSCDGVRPFVQHDAFRALTHGGVRDFRARGHAFLCQSFENLCGPNHGNVSGLAKAGSSEWARSSEDGDAHHPSTRATAENL